jgi:ribose transport system permease protein
LVFSGPRLLSNAVYVAAIAAITAGLALKRTPLGPALRSIGGNAEAAYLCGIDPSVVRIIAHGVAGASAALASMLFMADMDAAEPIAGLTTEWMEAIAAPIIGGNTLSGGRAYILGAVLGVLILSTIKSGLNMTGVDQHFQQIAIGSVIIAAVIVDSLRNRARTGGS